MLSLQPMSLPVPLPSPMSLALNLLDGTPPPLQASVDREQPVRSASAATTQATSQAVVAGFPTMVVGSLDVLENRLQAHTSNPATLSGAWGLSKFRCAGHKAGGRGFVQYFGCAGRDKSKCKWEIAYELTFGGWLPFALHHEHSGHQLKQTLVQAQVSATTQHIPLELEELGDLLAAAGLPAKIIARVFACWAMRTSARVSWDYKLVYNRSAPSPSVACKSVHSIAIRPPHFSCSQVHCGSQQTRVGL